VASRSHPAIAIRYLQESLGALNEFSDEQLFDSFVTLILTEIILSVYKIRDIKISPQDIKSGLQSIVAKLEACEYDLPELQFLKNEESLDLISSEFGLSLVNLDRDLGKYRALVATQSLEIAFQMEEMSSSTLFRVHDVKGLKTIYLNSNNECIVQASKNSETERFFRRFLSSYIKTIDDNPAMSDFLGDFNSYLALNLHRAFKPV
jgi:hypothetical protein